MYAPGYFEEKRADVLEGFIRAGKFTFSQNHPARNRVDAISGLRQRDGDGDVELAALMTGWESKA